MGTLEGKTAVVTGASSGIGLAAAQRLADEGAHVFITGRKKPALDAAAASLGSAATAVVGDIARAADLDRLYDAVRARGRGLDVLFANAGLAVLGPLGQATEADYEQNFDVNVRGTWLTVQKAAPLLNDGASVILNSSIRADDGWENFGLYSASKAAVRSLARTWANELKDRRIRVNTVSPGAIDTPAVDKVVDPEVASAFKAELVKGVPVGRLGRPEEVAAAVAFLASADSSFIYGANLDIDGGEHQV
ncbi:SDR family oxidoreductase [Mycolicibacterium austroafricanum]|jgi:NAD(P)-dependent dehydrogenase (short-subunit alcohol dehydrogenase family)|uniref:SDR family NAD(P)-dependent oxidoreductase n=1 Tax=Mycolicibacterium austroafricanum TaxID=39687 RepID=UPI001ABF7F20|nr:SDR family oxidoreductase [Mycolicibacterium austroafricanum]QRZ08269.1 SDR family oxidoreductase [Mycolicibacterium austroafricanum]QZT69921.1 SDR family oxidoreductase [Mycolicibacterium austroafricanum]